MKFGFILFLTLAFNIVRCERKKKQFSLFTLVQFPNVACTAVSSTSTNLMHGTCYSRSECTSFGGTPDGNCASGFGVCCMFSLSTCGSTVSRNCTYVTNPGSPTGFTTTGACTYSLQGSSNICQIRLDFNTFTVSGPTAPVGGVFAPACYIDTLTVTSASSTGSAFTPVPPVYCGVLTGSHMYIETGRVSNAGTVTINVGAGATTARNWKFKVSQIECGNPNKAPTDCMQYYTGISGTFSSFNFNSGNGLFVPNQNYRACFRQELGFCTMELSEGAFPATTILVGALPSTLKNFVLDAIAAAVPTSMRSCINSGILVPSTKVGLPGEAYCGAVLNFVDAASTAGVVPVMSTPFSVGVYSISMAAGTSVGFNLKYMQIPC